MGRDRNRAQVSLEVVGLYKALPPVAGVQNQRVPERVMPRTLSLRDGKRRSRMSPAAGEVVPREPAYTSQQGERNLGVSLPPEHLHLRQATVGQGHPPRTVGKGDPAPLRVGRNGLLRSV